jgi:dCTP diphosphatase
MENPERLKALLTKIIEFHKERNWQKWHSPKNLVLDLASELGELAEHFRWLTEEESANLPEKTLEEVRDEIGDVFRIIVYLSHKLGIDPIDAASSKLDKAAKKYPAHLSKDRRDKYTAYENPL